MELLTEFGAVSRVATIIMELLTEFVLPRSAREREEEMKP
jgi:hypothetical protein